MSRIRSLTVLSKCGERTSWGTRGSGQASTPRHMTTLRSSPMAQSSTCRRVWRTGCTRICIPCGCSCDVTAKSSCWTMRSTPRMAFTLRSMPRCRSRSPPRFSAVGSSGPWGTATTFSGTRSATITTFSCAPWSKGLPGWRAWASRSPQTHPLRTLITGLISITSRVARGACSVDSKIRSSHATRNRLAGSSMWITSRSKPMSSGAIGWRPCLSGCSRSSTWTKQCSATQVLRPRRTLSVASCPSRVITLSMRPYGTTPRCREGYQFHSARLLHTSDACRGRCTGSV
mmetsp:Transcript_78563/g.197409  ORF Transcript_78563/g.197409 Transcript_78563/m.197409 type:complete len:287 (+) Transcript_78563:933-1793(+)